MDNNRCDYLASLIGVLMILILLGAGIGAVAHMVNVQNAQVEEQVNARVLAEYTLKLSEAANAINRKTIDRLSTENARFRETFTNIGVDPEKVLHYLIPPGVIQITPVEPEEPAKKESFRKDGGGKL